MAIVTVIPHLSRGWLLVDSLVGMVHSWCLFSFGKGILRDVWKSIKWVPKMVQFWNPHLFLGWSFWRFFKHSIFDSGLSRLRWSDFGKLGSIKRFFIWLQTIVLTNLAIVSFTLSTFSKAYSRCTSSPPELAHHHPQLWLTVRHPAQDGPKVCVFFLGSHLIVPTRLKLQL